MERSEFQRIERLRSLFGAPRAPDVGIGDDCAVVHPAGPLAVTVDASVEGVHFRRDLLSLEAASARAVEAAASDIAAMGATLDAQGCGILLAWTLPQDLDEEDFELLALGAIRAARRLGTKIIGGNLSAGPALSLTTTVLGCLRARPLCRDGSRAGDVVAVSGPLGGASLGLAALLVGRGDDPGYARFVARWRAPIARVDVGHTLAGLAHAAIDLSDGLLQDAKHLAAASDRAIRLDAQALPLLPGHREAAMSLGRDPLALALTGGEDYELLATGPRAVFDRGWTVIGEVTNGVGVIVMDGGREWSGSQKGWDHFDG